MITAIGGYCIVQRNLDMYTLLEGRIMEGCSPLEYSYANKMVYEVKFLNPVSKTKYWYTPILVGEKDTIL